MLVFDVPQPSVTRNYTSADFCICDNGVSFTNSSKTKIKVTGGTTSGELPPGISWHWQHDELQLAAALLERAHKCVSLTPPVMLFSNSKHYPEV